MKKRFLILLVIVLIAVVGVGGTLCYFNMDTIKGWFGQDTNTAERYDYAAELKTLHAQIESNNAEISTLQKEINDKQAIINEKQAETNADVAAEIKALEATIAVLKSRIATLETENQNINAQIVELQSQINALANVEIKYGNGTFKSAYCSGQARLAQVGKVVIVTLEDIAFSNGVEHEYGTVYIENLPKTSQGGWYLFTVTPWQNSNTGAVRLCLRPETGTIVNHYSNVNANGVHYFGQIVYCVD